MGLTPAQPNIEFFTTECYSGPKQYDQFPLDNKHVFSMFAELFAPKSRGSVTLKSADPMVDPVVDYNYLADPLDVLVLSEGCRFGNEMVMKGSWRRICRIIPTRRGRSGFRMSKSMLHLVSSDA